jgi:outer membrane protein, heavy metal efflux system
MSWLAAGFVSTYWLVASPQAGVSHAPPDHPAEGESPHERALVEEALERNPDVLAAQAMVQEAEARPAQVTALPDPTLSVLYTNEGWAPTLGSNEFTTLGFLWSQELPGKGKRAARGEVARFDAALAEAQLARVRLGVASAVRRAYHELIHARELLALLQEQEGVLAAVSEAARERYAVGQGTLADVLRVQAEQIRLGQLRAERVAGETVQLAELNRLLARPHGTPLVTDAHPALRTVSQSLDDLLATAEAASPEIRAAQQAIERDRAQLRLAARAGQIDWSAQAGYQNRGGLPGMWQAGFGVRLPLWRDRVKAGIAEADARTRAGEQRLAGTRLLLRARTEERLARARAIEDAAELYAKGLLPQDRLAYEAALASFQGGRGAFSSVLEALTALLRDREAELRLLADHQILMAGLAEASLEATTTMGGGSAAAR